MTAPRQILPGTTYLVTRRCLERQYLLTPTRLVNDIFLFVLAEAARRYGIAIHAFCAMSNHYHLVVTDPSARLPEFCQFLDGFVARAVNASLARSETFWGSGGVSAVELISPDDVVEKTAYALANPVKAGLVHSGRLWPGAWSDPDAMGRGALRVNRPEIFFAKDGAFPATADLELTIPPGFPSADFFVERVTAAVAEKERNEVERYGRGGFLGVVAVLKRRPTSRPSSPEQHGTLKPRIAARDPWLRIQALTRLKEFLRSYRDAWLARRRGDRDVVFPAGTYLLRVAHGVPCAEFG